MKKPLYVILVGLLAIFLFAPVVPVQADVAPPPPPYSANIYPDGRTQVRMLAETVDLYVYAETSEDYPAGYAKVKATFTMQNMGQTLENMDVYFPMHLSGCASQPLYQWDLQLYPPIREFRAAVNGVEKPVTAIYRKALPSNSTDPLEMDIPCWSYFPTSFPAGKEITIEISYLAPPGMYDPLAEYASGYVSYNYILNTGAGWKDQIGSAVITVHMPYEITDINLEWFAPEGGTIQGRTITWQMQEFEPDHNDDINLFILKPATWQRIMAETQAISANPQDGEAWGRLGKAYKEAFIYPKGYRNDSTGLGIYQAGVEAYQKALALKPNDADWHAGYAELLCYKTIWDEIEKPGASTDFIPCVEQIKSALDLNPTQALANDLLSSYSRWQTGLETYILIDLSKPQPDYLILTPQPPTATPIATRTPQPRSPTPPPSAFTAVAANTLILPSPTFPLSPTVTHVPPTPAPTNPNSGVCASIALPVVMAAVVIFKKPKGLTARF